MRSDGSGSLVRRRGSVGSGHPLLQILVSFPIAFFVGALATDIAYVATANILWSDFSDWLLAAGIAVGAVAALVGLVAMVARRRVVAWGRVWVLAAGCVLVLLAALFDNLVHSRDAWTSVMPEGLVASAVTVVLTLVTAWFGFSRTLLRPVAVEAAVASERFEGVRA